MEKPVSQPCLRNQGPIAETLSAYLPDMETVLEIGSGTGQHAVFIAERFPAVKWQPTELTENLEGIRLWREESDAGNILEPLTLDVDGEWPDVRVDAVFTANTVHYISQKSVDSMFAGAGRVLKPGGYFFIYGPFNEGGRFTSEGNESLDQWLKADVNPEAGIKDLADIEALADQCGLSLKDNHAMPANNRILVLQKLSC